MCARYKPENKAVMGKTIVSQANTKSYEKVRIFHHFCIPRLPSTCPQIYTLTLHTFYIYRLNVHVLSFKVL